MAFDIAETAAFGSQHAIGPARFGHYIQDIRQRQARRGREAVFQVLMPLAEYLQIQRQHQSRTFRRPRALNRGIDEIFVFHHVKLKPEGGRGVFGHIFDGTDRHGRQGERHAEILCRAGGLYLAIRTLHARHANGGQRHRHGH